MNTLFTYEKKTSKLPIFLNAVLPGKLEKFESELRGPSTIKIEWMAPTSGGPVHGYKIMYWDSPESLMTIPVDKDVSFYVK